MREYILRRIASMVPVLLLVSMISFGLLYVLPGDPAIAILGENAGSTATYQALRQELGLDRPLWQQYAGWLGHVARGDLGTSIRSQEPVTTVLLRRMPISLYVGAAGLLVGILIGFPIAILSALRPGSKFDLIGTVLALGGIAIPSFWQALIFVYIFAVLLRWLPPSGYTSPLIDPWLSVKMLLMPAVVLGTHSAAVIMRQARSALIEVLGQDYITTAREGPRRAPGCRPPRPEECADPGHHHPRATNRQSDIRRGDRRDGLRDPGRGPGGGRRHLLSRLSGLAGRGADAHPGGTHRQPAD